MFVKRRRVPPALWGAIGIVLGLVVVFVTMAPRLVEITPAPGEEAVSASPTIRITFSRPMDHASVESGLTFDPPMAGSVTWQDQTLIFHPDQAWDYGDRVQVSLTGGVRSIRWLPLLGDRSWTVLIGAPRFLFLFPSDGRSDIYMQAIDSSVPIQLTTTEFGVVEYSRSWDGDWLVYSMHRSDGGVDFNLFNFDDRQERLLYTCPTDSTCGAPVLSPDNRYLAFEQAQFTTSQTGQRVTEMYRVMLLDLEEESSPQVVSDTAHSASSPAWSTSGLLAFYDNSLRAVVLINPGSSDFTALNYLPNNVGLVGDWSPDGQYIVLADILLLQESQDSSGEDPPFFSHLFRIDASTGQTLDLSAFSGYFVEDVSPAFSPDGEWIAFARKFLQFSEWTLGRQIWLMRNDGSGADQLTFEADFNHSALAWSADGQRLIYMLLDRSNSSQTPEIWMIDLESGEQTQLVEGGYLPQWVD